MRILNLIIILTFVSCASNKEKDSHPDISNDSFKKKKQVKYSKAKDKYQDLSSKKSKVLSSETAYRMEEEIHEDLADDGDIPAKIINNCYLKKFKLAYKIASKNHETYKTNPMYWNQVGSCFMLEKKFSKALLYFNKALEFNPSYVPVLNNIAVMYRMKGEDQKAQAMLKRTIQAGQKAKTPMFNQGQLFLDYGLYNKADMIFTKLHDSKKSDIDVANALAVSKIYQGNYQAALNIYKKIDDDFWEEPYVGVNVAYTQYKLGLLDDARDTLSDLDTKKLGKYSYYYSQLKKKVGVK